MTGRHEPDAGPPPLALWRRGLRLPTLLLLGFISAALIGGVVLMWQTIGAERSQRAQATRTNAILLALRDVTRTAVNGETGQRGYLLSLDRRYLAPYIVARARNRGNVDRLRDLAGTDITPRQRELLDEIEALNTAKFAEMAESVEAIEQGGLLEARRRFLTDEGQDVMERLRRSVAEMEELELAAFQQAHDQAVVAEARVIPVLVILLVSILLTLALGLIQVIRTADAEARAANAHALALARDRADLLARELNHRVKNLFAVVLAIVRMTGRDQPEAQLTVERIAARIHALLTAHEVTQGSSAQHSANLAALVETALKPYRSDDNYARIAGPPVDLPERAVVPLGLVLHELTTNAVKYGAWSAPGGEVGVTWSVAENRLTLDWQERCTQPLAPVQDAKARRGFGSSLIDGSARQLGGSIQRRLDSHGMAVKVEFPLTE